MNKKVLYTQEQLEIELLKQKNEDIFRLLARMENNIETHVQRLDSHISSNFHWTMGLICGLYTICVTSIITAFGHQWNWF